MPMLTTRWPSYQLGLLKPLLEREGIPAQAFSLFMHFGAQVGWRLYEQLAAGWGNMVGEWLWAPAAFGHDGDEQAYLRTYRADFEVMCQKAGCSLDDIVRVRHEKTRDFLHFCVERVDWSRFGLIGISVVMQQMAASLAMARALKERHPDIPIVLGGAAFEDDIAEEIMAGCPQVDFILCGEGETTFPEMVRRLYGGQTLTGLPGLVHRDGSGVESTPRCPEPARLDCAPCPDYDEYFHARKGTNHARVVPAEQLMLPVETSRGCHWGAHRQCIFCGLNRAGITYRHKSPDHVLPVVERLARRYGTRRFFAIDNIMPTSYVTEVFGRLAELRCDFQFHYATRPDLSHRQLEIMRRGGVCSIQPGVESLSTRLLGILRKPTTAMKNLELLKWATYYGMDNKYNLLVRIPGETAGDYEAMCDLMAKIPHYQAPYGMPCMRADRGSPMFTDAESFSIGDLEPEASYRHIYPSHRFRLERLAYFFTHSAASVLSDQERARFSGMVKAWQKAWQGPTRPRLTYAQTVGRIVIDDSRGRPAVRHDFEGLAATVLGACADARRFEQIRDACECDSDTLAAILRELVDQSLVVHVDDRYLSLALPLNRHW